METPTPETPPADEWQHRDVWLGLLFTAVGALITAYAWMARKNGMPVALWGGGIAFGPLMLLLGIHAIVRGIRARG
ncbi:MAG: hypothetical protein JNK78_11690 [Planctomycetes bacterium]|nr:hypothetical protein [Planctomycetota bacterium]